jgi:hypothetical protein
MDSMSVPLKDFGYIYESVLNCEDVEIKLARIDITTFSSVDLFVFRRCSEVPTVSNLGIKPKEMSPVTRLIYKWAAGPLREIRFALEKSLGVALDWSNVSDRNDLLYESALPLATLYSPLLKIDDTFILREYFIPFRNYIAFVSELSEIVLNHINKETILTLLNITIRFVKKDVDSALPYAHDENGVFAFVLYFRIRRTVEADQLLMKYHQIISNLAIREEGTFYLPYRHAYTDEQLAKAYPNFSRFCERKRYYDPIGLFGNLWWDRYTSR